MRQREIQVIIGAVLGLVGLALVWVWRVELVVFLKGALAVGLTGAGTWAVGQAAGVQWREILHRLWAQGTQQWQSLTAGQPQRSCPHCGSAVTASVKFCFQCGLELPPPKVCPRCHRVNLAEAAFCGDCGAALSCVLSRNEPTN